jgi:DNA-binding CsgD family transcriptional regulator
METIHLIIADVSQLSRLGIMAILRQIGYPFTVREVIHAEKLKSVLHNDHKCLFIIAASFLSNCSPDVKRHIFLKNEQISRILIDDNGSAIRSSCDFDEIIESNDTEKAIFRKLEKQVLALSKHDSIANQPEEISNREKEVLQLVALGMTNKEIAEKLFISSHTVITHRKNITSKLGIKTIAGLTVYAVIHKLISPQELH